MKSSSEVEEALKVVNISLSHIKWRLKPSSKRRLETDFLALCSGMRPVVMVDYGGKIPELQGHLCALIECLHKESTNFHVLRVMVIEDMIYLVNVKEFAEYVIWSLSPDAKLFFVDLEQDPPKMISTVDIGSAAKDLVSVQKLFSSIFTVDGVDNDVLQGKSENDTERGSSSQVLSQFSKVLDLSSCLRDSQITIPTLNGWLLGYPVIYLFGKEHIADAIYNLSIKSLRLFSVQVCRNALHNHAQPLEELMRADFRRSRFGPWWLVSGMLVSRVGFCLEPKAHWGWVTRKGEREGVGELASGGWMVWHLVSMTLAIAVAILHLARR